MPRGESRGPSPEVLTPEHEASGSAEFSWTPSETADLTAIAQEIASFRSRAKTQRLTDADTMRFQSLVETLQQKITTKESQGEASDLERKLNLREQYETQRYMWEKIGYVRPLTGGREGFTVRMQEYNFPRYEQLVEKLAEMKELLERKAEQGFKRVVIVPFGKDLADLRKAYGDGLKEHAAHGKLFRAKQNFGDPDEPITNLDMTTPVWQWDQYENADVNGNLVYYPTSFDQTNHGGTSKADLLKAAGGWQVLLVEERADIPRSGDGQELGGRKQLEANKTPNEYLEILKAGARDQRSFYHGEEGLTPEAWLALAMTNLDERNEVTDDYDGRGSVSYNVGAYFPSSGGVPRSYWDRGVSRVYLGGDTPDDRDAYLGARSSVRIY